MLIEATNLDVNREEMISAADPVVTYCFPLFFQLLLNFKFLGIHPLRQKRNCGTLRSSYQEK